MNRTERIVWDLGRLGYHVSTRFLDGVVEMHAVRRTDLDDWQLARCNDGDGPAEELRAAELLAKACGLGNQPARRRRRRRRRTSGRAVQARIAGGVSAVAAR